MELSDFHFIRPLWLLGLIPLVAMVWLSWHKKWRIGNWQAVCDTDLLPYLLQDNASSLHKKGYAPLALAALSALLAVISLAGPTWQRLPTPVFRNESALVIVLNLSITMDAADITPSRLVRARYKIADLLKRRKDGQTALLVYAGDAFVVTPLTTDGETIISQLPALTTDIMPSPGNNLDVALKKADDLFRQAGLTKGQIIVVTDTVDLQKTQDIAGQSAKAGYNVSVLAVGTEQGAPIAAPSGGFLKDRQGTIVIPKLQADNLRKLASSAGGTYQAITTNDSDVQALLGYTDQARVSSEGAKEDKLTLQQWDDKGPWLVLVVLPLAALLFRKGLLCWLLLMLLPLPKNTYALTWQELWQTKDQQAQAAYQQQQYDKAAEWFDNSDWKAAAQYKAGAYDKAETTLNSPASATSAYNLGNALAQSGKLQEAIKAYDKALALKPDDEDAKYNKALVEKELQKQQQDSPQQKSQKDRQQDQQPEGQSGQQQDQQDKGGEPKASDNDQKPEQKPEQSGDQSEAKQADQQPAGQDKQQGEEKQAQPASPQETQQPKETPNQKPKYASEAQQLSAEQQQANEQWLKRIPDDPSGLLKRKFKYQYGQRRPVQ